MRYFLWILACICLAPVTTRAADDMNDSKKNRIMIDSLQHKVDSLVSANKKIMKINAEIKAIEQRMNEFNNAVANYAQIQAEIDKTNKEIEQHRIAASEPLVARDKLILESLVPEVLNAPFNDSINTLTLDWLAKVDVIGDDEKAILVSQDMKLLNNYGAFIQSLEQFMKTKKVDMVNAKWAPQNGKWTAQFAKDLKKTKYYNAYETGDGGTIRFLSNAYDSLLTMNAKGFENCQDEIEGLLKGDIDTAVETNQQITLLQAKAELEMSAIKELNQHLDSLAGLSQPDSLVYNADLIRLNELKQQINEGKAAELQKEIAKWTDERDYYIAREYFSNLRRKPYNKEQLDKGVEYVMSHIVTEDLRQYVERYKPMMYSYPDYAKAIADALDGPIRADVVKYSRDFVNSITVPDWKAKIHAPLTKTPYWTIYDKAKRTHDTNSSILYLDEIIKEIEAMEAVGYKDCKERFEKVIKHLRDCADGILPFE